MGLKSGRLLCICQEMFKHLASAVKLLLVEIVHDSVVSPLALECAVIPFNEPFIKGKPDFSVLMVHNKDVPHAWVMLTLHTQKEVLPAFHRNNRVLRILGQ